MADSHRPPPNGLRCFDLPQGRAHARRRAAGGGPHHPHGGARVCQQHLHPSEAERVPGQTHGARLQSAARVRPGHAHRGRGQQLREHRAHAVICARRSAQPARQGARSRVPRGRRRGVYHGRCGEPGGGADVHSLPLARAGRHRRRRRQQRQQRRARGGLQVGQTHGHRLPGVRRIFGGEPGPYGPDTVCSSFPRGSAARQPAAPLARSSSPVAPEPGAAQVTADGGRRAHGRAHLKGGLRSVSAGASVPRRRAPQNRRLACGQRRQLQPLQPAPRPRFHGAAALRGRQGVRAHPARRQRDGRGRHSGGSLHVGASGPVRHAPALLPCGWNAFSASKPRVSAELG
mmetsp:Transcript_20732/g.39647  ORF Transcript_20732/g.39647 Transcript_20732/m.39647 type:complete len:345 (+) Transcript_20732:430-1464(+)